MSVNYEYAILTFEIRPPRGAPQVRDFASGAGCNRFRSVSSQFSSGEGCRDATK
jgi:hypothetical protein